MSIVLSVCMFIMIFTLTNTGRMNPKVESILFYLIIMGLTVFMMLSKV